MKEKDNELKRNASGYYDETAYKGIKNVQREYERADINPGEIYEYIGSGGKQITALVLIVHENTSLFLQLSETMVKNGIDVLSRNIMYTNPEMIQFVYNSKLTNYIKTITDDQYEFIMTEVKTAMGFDDKKTEHEDLNNDLNTTDIEALKDKVKKLEQQTKANEDYTTMLEDEARENQVQISAAKAERDLYKGLYEQLLEKFLRS